MNTAEIIYEKSKALPESFALEVLDFIGYLEQKKLKASPFKKTDVEQGLGCAGYTGETKSLNDMEQAIANDIRQQWHQA
ncbi:MAG: DUF2281 domain-containing protein [Methylobacter sp.]|uniref:DUF2281 domain-containing protein n=1 Tax=Methylobacter sp. TaxID=2051955 RepID=UPI0025CDF5FB|nr:DUF2281 domain-containing protein [Methylobacter sp.]MCK9621242.1 DUF2281 domain-containing protein [Methylobacter sp.]